MPGDKLIVCGAVGEAAEQLKTEGDLPLYVLTCFSDRDKLLSLTERD